VNVLPVDATVKGVQGSYLIYVSSSDQGTIQVCTYTGKNLLKGHPEMIFANLRMEHFLLARLYRSVSFMLTHSARPAPPDRVIP